MGRPYTIVSRDFSGAVRRTWACLLTEQAGPLLVFEGEFDREVVHAHLGRIELGTLSIEYFWLDRWFNIFRFHNPDGTFRNFYCNIAMPPTLNETSLNFTDLDIDIHVDAAGNILVLDEDEFRENTETLGYPPEVIAAVEKAIDDLTEMVRRRDFPFDHADFRNIRLYRS